MSNKPAVLVTRKLPEAVEARLRRDYKPEFNQEDRLYSSEELIEQAEGQGSNRRLPHGALHPRSHFTAAGERARHR